MVSVAIRYGAGLLINIGTFIWLLYLAAFHYWASQAGNMTGMAIVSHTHYADLCATLSLVPLLNTLLFGWLLISNRNQLKAKTKYSHP